MTEIPYMTNNEFQITGFPATGQGGSDVLLMMGESPEAQDLNEINVFYSYFDALNTLGPLTDDNILLQGIYNAFLEGSKYQNFQSPTISKIYAINMGPNPTKGDYETAAVNSEIKRDINFEVYLSNYNVTNYVSHMVAMGARLETLEEQNDYRQAVYTLDPTLDVADKCAVTKITNPTYVRDNRVIIHENEAIQAAYAADMACTPYYIEPSQSPYRSIPSSAINEYSYADLNSFLEAGIVCDYKTPSRDPSLVDTATPVVSISTAHTYDADGNRGLDTYSHVRRNVDYQWGATDLIAQAELKNNNTETSQQHLISAVTSFFVGQVAIGSINPQTAAPSDPGYYVDCIPDVDDANMIHLLRGIRPVNAEYFIDIQSDIYAPAAVAIDTARMAAWNQ
jgi:hypothetical protein